MGQYVTLRQLGVRVAQDVSHDPQGDTDEHGVGMR